MAADKNENSLLSLYAKPKGMTLKEWQIALRKQIAQKESYTISPLPNSFGEYVVSNRKVNSNRYKVTYRGDECEWNYCSCMDFRTSKLGTCKHIEAVKLTNPAMVLELPPYSSVYLSYVSDSREIKIRIGYENRSEIISIASKYFDSNNVLKEESYKVFNQFVEAISKYNVHIYTDALEYATEKREAENRRRLLEEKYSDAEIDSVIKTTLYPYQKEGVRFAFKNGRAIIADEMGLGKTIQAICTAELYLREGLASTALIVCPTSLKYQWKREIERFTGSDDVLVIEGDHLRRSAQYKKDNHYKIVSYNSLCNDIKVSKEYSTDLVVLDEVQRLKNWNTQIAKAMRKLRSSYSVILSGTPLENKLEDLYSIMQLADQFCLGPYYMFRSDHIITDENGKTLGYKNLNSIKDSISNVLIRRKKSEVQLQLPERIDKNLLIPITENQLRLHEEFKVGVSKLVNKWKKMKSLSEPERLRLMMLLGSMRMVCDSTFVLDQQSRDDTKVDEVVNIVKETLESTEEKVVVFSQWERMTRIISQELDKSDIKYEYLHGGVPSTKRKSLIDNFCDDPETRVFLSTDAGGVGLNLQAASVVINVDLPWNPAILEQRIARIWRIGQKRNIQVINLIAKGTIEEGMISRLKFKSAMAQGVLDGGEDTVYLDEDKFSSVVETIGAFLSDDSSNIDRTVSYKDGEEELQSQDSNESLPTHDNGSYNSHVGDRLSIVSDNNNTSNNNTSNNNPLDSSTSGIIKKQLSSTGVSTVDEESIRQGILFMEKMQELLSSKAVCNMLVGAMSMEDPMHVQDHIKELEENKLNIEKLINLFRKIKDGNEID